MAGYTDGVSWPRRGTKSVGRALLVCASYRIALGIASQIASVFENHSFTLLLTANASPDLREAQYLSPSPRFSATLLPRKRLHTYKPHISMLSLHFISFPGIPWVIFVPPRCSDAQSDGPFRVALYSRGRGVIGISADGIIIHVCGKRGVLASNVKQ